MTTLSTYALADGIATITMDDGSAVILSVAKYYSPNPKEGKAIQDSGVTPGTIQAEADSNPTTDEEEESDAPPAAAAAPAPAKGGDPVLSKAFEILKK